MGETERSSKNMDETASPDNSMQSSSEEPDQNGEKAIEIDIGFILAEENSNEEKKQEAGETPVSERQEGTYSQDKEKQSEGAGDQRNTNTGGNENNQSAATGDQADKKETSADEQCVSAGNQNSTESGKEEGIQDTNHANDQDPLLKNAETERKPKKKVIETIDFTSIDKEHVDRAAKREEYEVYQNETATLPGGDELKLFAASRIGLGHLGKGTACQDSCLYRTTPKCVILTDADGISACSRSDTGSRMACEVAADEVEAAELQYQDEMSFIHRLCSDEFYIRLRGKWIESITKHWVDNGGDENIDPRAYYGTTLLIAVITDNWYVTLNLGDGQILLFNDTECMRTQLVDKESQAPSSLIYDEYLEDVRRGVWPRQNYQGILLMTDGMNDRLSMLRGYPCHQYAVQTAKRFLNNAEPRQPFILTAEIDGLLRTYDVSRQKNASDDCSVVMAINTQYDITETDQIHKSIRDHIPGVMEVHLLRRIGHKASYLIRKENEYSIVLVIPENKLVQDEPQINVPGVQKWDKKWCWKENDFSYAEYGLPEKVPSLFLEEESQEFVYKSAKHYHKIPDSYDPKTFGPLYTVEPLIRQDAVTLVLQLRKLNSQLGTCQLKLNEMAFPWILRMRDDQKTLLIPQEVLSKTDEQDPELPWYTDFDRISPALIGYLSSGQDKIAVYSTGAAKESYIYYFFGTSDSDPNRNQFFQVVYSEKARRYGLKNISAYKWLVSAKEPGEPDKMLNIGTIAAFAEGKTIKVMKDEGIFIECVMHVL